MVLLLLLVPWSSPARGQEMATLRVEENLRAEPQGVVLGRLAPGARVRVRSVQEAWVQVDVEGWLWTRSLQATDRMGFDLRVSADPEENLRTEPSGAVLGQLVAGALLEEREGVPEVSGWTPVRRTAWIWAASVDLPEPEAQGDAPAPGPALPPMEQGGEGVGWWSTSDRAPLLTGPDGDTLGVTRPGAEGRVLAREGNWIRVRLEGWVWSPLEVEGAEPVATEMVETTRQDVADDPEAYRGRLVSWELQYVSLERAERIRTDFYEGEPFLLTRTPSGERGFVYVAVPPERLGEVEGLIPLERIRVVGRVRTGAAGLTGNPILDLMDLTRLSGT